ncbi:Non-heme 11 kDa protein of cytochrome bc1 complex [Mycena olivaceomarginata]|nr:Non-heme 11 kDa protein of cytochrome bc1 complex [Mycena olivaceomarginata]
MSGLGSFSSSFFPTTHADSEEEEQKPAASKQEAEAEEEEEPEDEHPKIRADCEASPACAPMKHHFEKCQEKVNAGEGYKGEDCVDGMCVYVALLARSTLIDPDLLFPSPGRVMMHCSEACAAPKLFSKLR